MSDLIADRLRPFGTTIFSEMSALAQRTGAIDLGQGFPDVDGPAEIVEVAARALRDGPNQYAPARGIPELRQAVADHQRRFYGIELDPDTQVQATIGATEGLAAALIGLGNPGDAVIVFEPYYDCYAAGPAMAGLTRRTVSLRPPDFGLDVEALRAAAKGDPARPGRASVADPDAPSYGTQPGDDGRGARFLILNSPHNPTGKIFDRGELEQIAAVCREHDLIAICDEVYEHLAFDAEHVPLCTLDGMAERTLTVSSAGKTFSLTGWKIGWVTGPAPLVAGVAAAKQYLTFSGLGPLQRGIAHALAMPDGFFADARDVLRAKRDRLCAGLRAAGLEVLHPQGGYFATADIRSIGEHDGRAFCRDLPQRAGLVAVPVVAFYDDEAVGLPLIRFAFCKQDEVIDEAVERLAGLRGGS
ncbi:MAG: aminotransferase class I/II-fold pyridoxal phosphate-dependent enzyme [Patulibacter sp.]